MCPTTDDSLFSGSDLVMHSCNSTLHLIDNKNGLLKAVTTAVLVSDSEDFVGELNPSKSVTATPQ